MTQTVKVKYNQTTTKVEGYFPSNLRYPNNAIDEQAKTIDGSPYIEVTKEEHEANLGKKMAVVGGSFVEYVKTNDELLQEAKSSRLGARKIYLKSTDWYVSREVDSPNSYPQEVKDKRILARTEINAIEPATTLAEVEQYSETFE